MALTNINSLGVSPASLLASCELVRHAISNLDAEVDRVAIYTTIPDELHDDEDTLTALVPHGSINKRKTKSALDCIPSCNIALDEDSMASMVDKIHHNLLNPHTPFLSDDIIAENTFGHLFILTPHAKSLGRSNLSHRSIQTHILAQGCSRQEEWAPISNDGWVLACPPLEPTDPRVGVAALLAPLAGIKELFQNSRAGNSIGSLRDLQVGIQPGKMFRVGTIDGDLTIPCLRPGERRTVLLKLRQARSSHASDASISPISLFNPSIDGDSLVSELDRMLSTADMTALNVDLTYKHPLLPKNTICHVNEQCQLDIAARMPPASDNMAKQSLDVDAFKRKAIKTDQLFALHTVQHWSAQKAIDTLQARYGLDGSTSACPGFIDGLLAELKYQVRLETRQTLQNSPLKPRHLSIKTNMYDSFKTLAPPPHFNLHTAVGQPENFKPRDWIVCPDDTSEINQTLPVRRPSVATEPVKLDVSEQLGFDEARKIWNDIRNASKGIRVMSDSGNKIRGRSPATNADPPGTGSMIEQQALRNQRSLGASTLRSFTAPVKARGGREGVGAPWL